MIVRVWKDKCLYEEDSYAEETTYLVLYGSFKLFSKKMGTIGTVATGDSLGEEGLFERSFSGGPITRKESAYAKEDSFVLELTKKAMVDVQRALSEAHLNMDWFTLNNALKGQWIQKKSWRTFRHKQAL